MLSRSIALGLVAATLLATPAWAQGSQQYTFYFGGQGGLMSVKGTDALGTRDLMATAGAHILVTGNRTGLLVAVDQSFGTNKKGSFASATVDSLGAVIAASSPVVTYTGVRRYTFAVMLFPVQHSIIQPYLGIGGGILHTTGNTGGAPASGTITSKLGTQGFLTAIGGLEFRVAGLSAFGQAQITSAPALRTVVTRFTNKSVETDQGSLFQDASYSVMAGLRFSLGSARSSGGPASY
jgi:hypothetical protein